MSRSKWFDKMTPDLTKSGQGRIQADAHRNIEERLEAVEDGVESISVPATPSSIGAASLTEPYVTISASSGLSAERVLTGTSNQITVTDGGANSTVTLSTPQDLHTAATFRVASLGIAGPAPVARFLAFYNAGITEGIAISAPAAGLTSYGIILPNAAGAAGSLLQHPGGLSAQLAWVTPSFVTTAAEAQLASERVLTGTANQIVITDNGAGSTVVLSTPQNLHTSAVFQVGTLGVGAAASGGFELDVTGQTALRGNTTISGDVTIANAAMLFQYLGAGVPLRIEYDSGVLGNNVLELYDTASAANIVTIDSSGQIVSIGANFAMGASGTRGTLTATALSTDRTWTFPNTSGTVMVTAGTEAVTGNRTVSGVWTFTAASVLEVSAAADVRLRDGSDSSKLRFIDMSTQTTSTSRVMALHDSSHLSVGVGDEVVAAAGSATAGKLGKHDSTANTASIAATTLGNAVPAGLYRVSLFCHITDAGDIVVTDNITFTVAWNDGAARTATPAMIHENGTIAAPAFAVDTLNRRYIGYQLLFAAAGTNITVATTVVNGGADNFEYTLRARLEAI